MIKAVFIDIDGTLINSRREINERTKDIVRKCIERNIKIVLTSGRSRYDTLNYKNEVGASPYIISSNGAEVYDINKKKVIYSEPIEKKRMIELFNYAEKNNYKINLNYDTELIMNVAFYPDEMDRKRTKEQIIEVINTKKIVQCVISSKELEKLQEFKKYIVEEMPELKIVNESKRLKNPNLKPSSHYYCDITSSIISKGKAVKELCKYLNINKDDIIVIGDGENDISMFEVANYSVAMENAIEQLKAKSNYITDSNDEDGVAKFLEKLYHNL